MHTQEDIWNKEYQRNKQKWKLQTKTLPNTLVGKRVLEIGVGNGKTLKAILKQKPISVIAIDSSQEAIMQCGQQFKGETVEFMQANLVNLPFPSNNFHVVVCYYTLNNLLKVEREQAVNEIFRVLKPGGKIIFEDFAAGDFREKSEKKKVEDHTVKNNNGLICHFFSMPELKDLFQSFSSYKLTLKRSKPIIRKPELIRKIIHGIVTK